MAKIVHLYGNYYLGISYIGLTAFVVQELPYMIMPLVKLEANPIMNMQAEIKWLETVQSIFGVLSMLLLMLLVRDDVPIFSISGARERLCFSLSLAMIITNFIGWTLYYTGRQYGWLIVASQFAAVPLYYLCIGAWRKNYPLVATSRIFFLIHIIKGYLNLIKK